MASRPQIDTLAFFSELQRLMPEGPTLNVGFTMPSDPREVLAALRALPDGAGEDAVLRVLGHDPDAVRRHAG